ncbi:DeoR/GlpR family DNA-binding transcription regulator [Propionimicrobium lymphophilum]|uniref:HTH deoR-type domain-containing protein n=1 Tax=Propionimicrobium lymphophilum ACS-093-V-SCH5 TaxID=883161 RepID=S2WL15_9ACTN|nr:MULTISPECIES: DeoR/GlpR family DNA-binding transcription regulator [Propionimicrobium]EPD33337.1 hypothetical protein HMPREF9306_00876 [Propionimicrobium lymphophilum ACS-093-V-SCH5]ETJ98210.1 transcriptional regulator, DeoR family [Propionimicrobium sp. BV2F7]MDK7709718.1 DeoR/GlpR family DNA-binding transcription regulator [Propionimicrobium lymphophilum]MDK7734020.1 DeoR/GlpR family DNA-binding transcription regulator [Propionimicrobium lymphophilum]
MTETNNGLIPHVSRRQARLTNTVIDQGSMTVEQLATFLDVSVVTIYRDLALLENEGILTLKRGIVEATTSTIFDRSSSLRSEIEQDAKNKISALAAPLVPRGASLAVDDSSTALPALDRIIDKSAPITLITNSLAVLKHANKHASVDVQLTGGKYYSWSNSFYGPLAIKHLDDFQIDFCMMSDTAIFNNAVWNPYDYVTAFKQKMLEVSRTKILMADSSKFHRKALTKTCELGNFDFLITDEIPPKEIAEYCKSHEVEILHA